MLERVVSLASLKYWWSNMSPKKSSSISSGESFVVVVYYIKSMWSWCVRRSIIRKMRPC